MLFLFISFFVSISTGIVVSYASEGSAIQCEEKRYWSGTINDEISDNCVLVVVDKFHSGINKVHEDSFFGTFEKSSITDLTAITGNINERKRIL